MPRYKLSPEERAAEKERKENLRNLMQGLEVKNFDDLKEVFKMMVGEMLENGLEGELDDELGYTKYVCPPRKNGHRKASKNGMNRNNTFVFKRRPHLFDGSLDNEPLAT